ncbi:uncharacterized protein [Onthophagus taurus]|uniref:uncharacterized protein n=1 Tax=Onthophagus taurus TaxID=166361 RepID=UPI0039BE932B
MIKIKSFVADSLEIVLCLYGVIQYLFGKTPGLKTLKKINGINIIFVLLSIIFSLISLILLTILLLPLAAYKKVVSIYLKSKYKDDFGEMLEGIDNLWAIETKQSRHIINALMYIEYNDSKESIMARIYEVFKEKLVYQFTCVRKRELGYYFRLLNRIKPEDLISKWNLSDEELSNKDAFEDALRKISNQPMPINDTACFQLLASMVPITFSPSCNNNNGNSKKVYPIMLRIHHSVGDGVALLSFLLKNVSDEKINVEEEIVKRIMKNNTKPPKKNNLSSYVTKVIDTIKKISNLNVYYFAPIEKRDQNCLHGPSLSGKQILTSYLEENPVYVNKIKSIKKRIPGCSFSDVILTAISASFHEYFTKYAEEVPETMCLSFILKRFDKNLNYTVTYDGKKEFDLGNHFSMGMLKLPIRINVNDPRKPLQERLYKVKEESEKIRNSVDILLYYWQLKFFTNLLPAPVLNLIMKLNETVTTSFSNLPGIEGVHIKGYKVKDIVFWVPPVRSIGIGLSILTYDNRFQMGLLADEILISKRHKAQSVLNNIIKHIDDIDNELK